MAKDPAFLFYPGDYLRDTQCLSEKAQVAYDRIMCEHMRNISEDMNNIVITKERVNFFIKRLSEDEKLELFHVMTKKTGGYQIDWVAESICKRKSYSNSRANNRSGKNKEHMNNISEHMEDEDEIDNENIKDNKYILPEMQKVFKKRVLNYITDDSKDFEPLLSIAKFIHTQEKLNGDVTKSNAVILDVWDKISIWISKDSFYSQKSLKTISTYIQEILNKSKNGTPKQTSGTTKFNAGAIELLEKGKAEYEAIRRKQGN